MGLQSKGLYKSFVLFYPLIVHLHPYGVSLWQKYGNHDSLSLGQYPLVKYMCGYVAVRGHRLEYALIGDDYIKVVSAASKCVIMCPIELEV